MDSATAQHGVPLGIRSKLADWHVCALLTCVYAIFATGLLTNFDFNLVGAEQLGLLFNDMAQRLMHLDWTITPGLISTDQFDVGGRTYTYWGILPAIARMPLVLLGFGNVITARLSCVLALAVYVGSNIRLAQVIVRWAKSPQAMLLAGLWIASLVLCGPPAYLLNNARPNNEAVFWAAAITAVFNYVVLSAYFRQRWPEDWSLVWLSVLAGLTLLTRAPNAVGLYVVVSMLTVRQVWQWHRHGAGRGGPIVVVALTLTLFVAVTGAVNTGRWGNPLVIAPLEKSEIVAASPRAVRIVTEQGSLNAARIPLSTVYYLTGIPAKAVFERALDAHFAFVEGPRMPLLLVSPLPLLFACSGLAFLFRTPRSQTVLPAILIGGNVLNLILVLAIPFLAWRYTFDAWGAICTSGAIGLAGLLKRRQSKTFVAVLTVLLLVGMSASAVSLVRYKIVSIGVPAQVRYALSRKLQPWVCPTARLTGSVADQVPLVTPSCPPFW